MALAVIGAAGCRDRGGAPALEGDIFASADGGAKASASAGEALRPLIAAAGRSVDLPAVTVDYPVEGALFPPEIVAPTILWHDPDRATTQWLIDVSFTSTPHRVYGLTSGARIPGEIDPAAVSASNTFHESEYQASAKGWTPDERVWEIIKRYSTDSAAKVTITGLGRYGEGAGSPVVTSRGAVNLRTSKDPVGACIFYRDVPLMPSRGRSGEVMPLREEALPLVKWRLREISKPAAPEVMENLSTCGNCHSFSRDGRVLTMDVDGRSGDKGAHLAKEITPEMVIETKDIFTWNTFKGPNGESSLGLFPHVSPDGRHVIATLHETIYAQNFMDYTFLQTFYPTRGILAFYTRATGRIAALPGADDRRYVQTNPAWSPDGKEIVFLRAEGRLAYPSAERAQFANDPRETQIQFDIYRIPFNDGKGGAAEPVPGGSRNGKSNSFPKFSPDGKWLVFVQCRKGLLMRPDSELYIMPAQGGVPRRMTCNTARMNSWHSWSPNSRWLVFSSKCNTPFTQMFLTHVDENGNDTPPVLIPNSTAANRAVNLPEFARIPPGGLKKITVPAMDYRMHLEKGRAFFAKGLLDAAAAEMAESIAIKPNYLETLETYGAVLLAKGETGEAEKRYRKALEINPDYWPASMGLARSFAEQGKLTEALAELQKCFGMNPGEPQDVLLAYGDILTELGRLDEAVQSYRKAIALDPEQYLYHRALGVALGLQGKLDEALVCFKRAVELNPNDPGAHFNQGLVLVQQRRLDEAVAQYRTVLRIDPEYVKALNALALVLAAAPDAGLRNGKEATVLGETACRKTNNGSAELLETLACAYAEAGRFGDAARTAEKALGLARAGNDPQRAAEIESRLELFKRQQPFRLAK